MSVKDRVESTVSDTRKAFNQTPLVDTTPTFRTAVGLTYNALSEQISTVAVAAQNNGGTTTNSDIQRFLDSLYAAPRLKQWHHIVGGVFDEFRLYTTNDAIYVSVIESRVWITKGIREFDIISGPPALALYKALDIAQSIIQPTNPKPMTEEEQEEFFSSSDANGADIDSALADSPAGDAKPEGYTTYGEDDDDNAIGLIEEAFIEEQPVEEFADEITESEGKRYVAQTNEQNSKTDGVECGYCGNFNLEGPYKGSCPKCPKAEKPKAAQDELARSALLGRSMISNMKSLQGRILTIIDGTFADKVQREAVKTLINKEFRREITKAGGGQ